MFKGRYKGERRRGRTNLVMYSSFSVRHGVLFMCTRSMYSDQCTATNVEIPPIIELEGSDASYKLDDAYDFPPMHVVFGLNASDSSATIQPQPEGKWYSAAGGSHSCSISECSEVEAQWRREKAEEIMYSIFRFPYVTDYSVFDANVHIILSQEYCSCAETSVEGNHKCENQLDHMSITQPYNLDDAWDFPPLPGESNAAFQMWHPPQQQ